MARPRLYLRTLRRHGPRAVRGRCRAALWPDPRRGRKLAAGAARPSRAIPRARHQPHPHGQPLLGHRNALRRVGGRANLLGQLRLGYVRHRRRAARRRGRDSLSLHIHRRARSSCAWPVGQWKARRRWCTSWCRFSIGTTTWCTPEPASASSGRKQRLRDWQTIHRARTGEMLAPRQVWELSKLWYHNRLSPDYHGRTASQAADFFPAGGPDVRAFLANRRSLPQRCDSRLSKIANEHEVSSKPFRNS